MARRGTPLAKKVARPTRFDERLLVRACTPRIIPRLAGYSQRILSSRVTARSDRGRGDRFIRYYSDIVAVKRGAVSLLCAVIHDRSNYRLLDIKRRIRWPVRPAEAINGSRRSRSDNWIEQFFPSLHKYSPTLFLPIVAIRLLVISTPFSTSLPGFIPSPRVRNCPPHRRPKINSKNSGRFDSKANL